jgi:NAD(P)-dependent dehydrogenase (short-subunit alcohol dehydrogenase family)
MSCGPLMRGRGWGRIINMASATVATASPVSIAYRTSKMGVIGFTRALSATLGDDGVTVNVAVLLRLAPGARARLAAARCL